MEDRGVRPWLAGIERGQVTPLIESDERVIRVQAGPGTGKTLGIRRRVLRLLHPEGLNVDPDRVLVCAFNRAIARDLVTEIKAELDPHGLPLPHVKTIHALCSEIARTDARFLLPHEVEEMVYDVRQARQPNPLANPFRPGNGVPPPYLAGRERVFAAFDDWLLEEPPLHANWALTGLRGTGKTVLLGEFATRAERAGWLTLQRELGDRHRDDVRFAEALVEDCEALIGRADAIAAVGQVIERGARWLRPKRIRVGQVSVDPAYASNVPAAGDAMRTAFAQLDSVLSHGDRPGAILLYDEAHLLADDRGRERFPLSGLLAALGAAQRERPRVRIIVSGLPTLSLNLKRARTYAERMFRHVPVGNLEADAADEALAIPLAGSGRGFGLSLIGEIVEQTAGYPYFLQFFGAFICSRIGLAHIELADYQRVESALLHELDLAFFEDRFEAAPPTEQLLLTAMARAGGRVSLNHLQAELHDPVNVPVGLRRLIDRGLVYRPTRAMYDFALPLFAAYVRRRAKITKLSSAR